VKLQSYPISAWLYRTAIREPPLPAHYLVTALIATATLSPRD